MNREKREEEVRTQILELCSIDSNESSRVERCVKEAMESNDPGKKRCSSNCFLLTVDAHVAKKNPPKTIFYHLFLHRCHVYWNAHLQNIFRCFWKQTANPASPLSASRRPRRGSAARRRSCCSQVSMQLCFSPAGDKETSSIRHSQGCCSSCVQSSALLWSGMFLQS